MILVLEDMRNCNIIYHLFTMVFMRWDWLNTTEFELVVIVGEEYFGREPGLEISFDQHG